MKKQKRKLMVVNSMKVGTLIELAEAHTAALLILNHIKCPPEAAPYLDRAIGLFAQTLKDLNAQFADATGTILSTQHVIDAFSGPSDEAKAEAVAG